MKAKQYRAVVTFHTTAEAMAMEKLCHDRNIPGKLISAPRSLSADCGIAWHSPLEFWPNIERAVEESSLEIEGIYKILL